MLVITSYFIHFVGISYIFYAWIMWSLRRDEMFADLRHVLAYLDDGTLFVLYRDLDILHIL